MDGISGRLDLVELAVSVAVVYGMIQSEVDQHCSYLLLTMTAAWCLITRVQSICCINPMQKKRGILPKSFIECTLKTLNLLWFDKRGYDDDNMQLYTEKAGTSWLNGHTVIYMGSIFSEFSCDIRYKMPMVRW